ncbi:E3 ubiquitin-protein ligase TRIM39-like [Hyperolius riggenbachi]|uniref:E3 ubiquitin-protein ligase TRIM39-like n=1 Tax=Hyperolius riggenbachi TaxID=752182 RepID=UPI0035A2FBEC
MASADVTAELRCSICMEIYRDPVTLPCGHNFCRGCITQAWDLRDDRTEHKCPECQRTYRKRPELVRNTTLHNIAKTFHATDTDQEQTRVFCNYCDLPVPATKSCLQCETSLCDHHLRTHDMSGEHTLLPPTTDLGKRKCSVHKEILKYYCTEDAVCVCASCSAIGGHVGHKMLSLHEASEEKKKKLRNYLQKLMAEKEKAEKRVQSLEERRRKAQEKADSETEKVTDVFRDLRRRLEDLEAKVLSDITRQVQCNDDVIRWLKIKKEEVSKKMRHIEELCHMTDPLTVLQESDTGLADILNGVTGGMYIQPANILLDVNTAYNDLHISADRKTVFWSDHWQNPPKTPERFQDYPQVLSIQSFSSGRHYWEVDVEASDRWIVGMCYPSIDRRGRESVIGWNKKSWGLCRDDNQCSVRHGYKDIRLPDKIPSDRVRIYLDYEAGQISFYALCDPIRHLHTFTATFTEPLHAGLYLYRGCIKISGGNHWK